MKKILGLSKSIMLNQFAISLLCLVIVPGVFMFMRNSMGTTILVFSVLACLYLFFLNFVELNKIGIRELRNPKLYKTNAFKGFLIGLIGQLPVWVITLVFVLNENTFFKIFVEDFRVYMANIFTIQYIWLLKSFNFTVLSYIIAFAAVPVICGIGYYTGMKGFSYEDRFGAIKK